MVGPRALRDEHADGGVRHRRAARRRGDHDPRSLPLSRVVVYTAPGCHLCDPALETVRAVCGDDYELVDISADAELERRYRTWIPLVTVDGVERFRYEVDGDGLQELLA